LFFAFVLSANSQTTNSSQPQSTDSDKIYKSTEVDRKVKITKKPHPYLGWRIQECKVPGEAMVRLVYHKSGVVTNVELFRSSPCKIWDEEALNATKKIKFKPAIKDGHPVSTAGAFEFSYSVTL
jgi:TonB family protein